MKDLLKKVEDRFADKLKLKTGWGRNEVLMAYRESVIEVLAEELERANSQAAYIAPESDPNFSPDDDCHWSDW